MIWCQGGSFWCEGVLIWFSKV